MESHGPATRPSRPSLWARLLSWLRLRPRPTTMRPPPAPRLAPGPGPTLVLADSGSRRRPPPPAASKPLGWVGVDVASGRIDWDHNPALTYGAWRGDSGTIGVGRQMCAEDPDCARIVHEYASPVLAASWTAHPADDSDPEAVAVAEALTDCLIDADTWQGLLYDAALAIRDGVRIQEVWARWDPDALVPAMERDDLDRGWRRSGPAIGRRGLYVPVIEPRLPHSIDTWVVDGEGHLTGIQQTAMQDGRFRIPEPIPVERLVRYTYRQEGNNWEGTSILRPCYGYWLLRREIVQYWGMGFRRWAVPSPMFREAIPNTIDAADWDRLQTISEQYSVDPHQFLGVPYGAEMTYYSTRLESSDALDHVFDRAGRAMHHAAGTEHVYTGEGQGARSLQEAKVSLFLANAQHLAEMIAEALNRQLVRQWASWNGIPPERTPWIGCGELLARDPAAMATAYEVAVRGRLVTAQPADEDQWRELMGLPARDPEASAAAAPPPVTTQGGEPEPAPEAPAPAPAPDPAPEPAPAPGQDEDQQAEPGRMASRPPGCGIDHEHHHHEHRLAIDPTAPPSQATLREIALDHAAQLGPAHLLAEGYFLAASSRLGRQERMERIAVGTREVLTPLVEDYAERLAASSPEQARALRPAGAPEIAAYLRGEYTETADWAADEVRGEIRRQRRDPEYAAKLAAALEAEPILAASSVPPPAGGGSGSTGPTEPKKAKRLTTDELVDYATGTTADSIVDAVTDAGRGRLQELLGAGVQPTAQGLTDAILGALTADEIESHVMGDVQGVYATARLTTLQRESVPIGVYTLTPELGGRDGTGHVPCKACQETEADERNPFRLDGEHVEFFACPSPRCFGGSACWCTIIGLSSPRAAED